MSSEAELSPVASTMLHLPVRSKYSWTFQLWSSKFVTCVKKRYTVGMKMMLSCIFCLNAWQI